MDDVRSSRILVIEDDTHIAEGLRINLSLQGYEVIVSGDGTSGIQEWRRVKPHLVILDIMLPTIDGLTVLQAIRLSDERQPVLILSARAESEDIIKGLSYGVDDYLGKPFNLEELLLRVERLLKRAEWGRETICPEDVESVGIYRFGDNSINFNTGLTTCQMGQITLTEQELTLLRLFITNRGKPLNRNTLLEVGWGYTRNMNSRTVDNFVVRLRKYFEPDPKNPHYFRSIRSVGYIFDPTPPDDGGLNPW